MSGEPSDLEAGLRAYLLDQASVTALVATRVFGGELPADETASMPRGSLTTPGAGERGTESPPPPVESPRQMHEFQSVSRPSW